MNKKTNQMETIVNQLMQISREYVDEDQRFLKETAKKIEDGSITEDTQTENRLRVFAHRRVTYSDFFNKVADLFKLIN